jgi:ADP-ribose pyrophosphatase YjhB (NUDIX family)
VELLLTINDNTFEPQDYYIIRKVVRAVILDETETKVLFFGSLLVGGGVEDGESDEDALHRESMEEVGATVKIIKPLGEVISYRDYLKKKYIVHGYLCKKIGELVTPTSTDPEEQLNEPVWVDIITSIKKLEDEISSLESNRSSFELEVFQRKVHNRKVALTFLKEII